MLWPGNFESENLRSNVRLAVDVTIWSQDPLVYLFRVLDLILIGVKTFEVSW